jgi:hypothetical protein
VTAGMVTALSLFIIVTLGFSHLLIANASAVVYISIQHLANNHISTSQSIFSFLASITISDLTISEFILWTINLRK